MSSMPIRASAAASGDERTEESATALAFQRLFDVGGALAALILLSPLFAFAILSVLAGDGRPVFFRQRRVGRNGEPFLILKFRTMQVAADGRNLTVSGDGRVTRTGAWLRKRKLDELPQLINVLRGDMSLIGPRPEVPEYVEPGDTMWCAVLRRRPGITDLASLLYRDEEELLGPAADPDAYYRASILPAKLGLNLRYQQSRSLARDLKLLWMTAWYSFFPAAFDRERVLRTFTAPRK
jgi:lipopolysaccharide/colanic/teichoic acid biosynthesis glycosyltransferase